MKKFIKRILKNRGKQIKNFPDAYLERRLKIMNYCNIDTLFDIGASNGQYAIEMREIGYGNIIISFEPLKSSFKDLEKASLKDNNWIINNYALGNEDTKGVLNVAGNSDSSSILNMLPMHLESAPWSKYIGQQEIEIKKLDSVFNSFVKKEDRVMIKIDTQGYERNVIDGASASLNKIQIIQLEMSIVPLYENEMTYIEMIKYLDNKGYQLFSLEDGFSHPTSGQLLQVDGIFVKRNLISKV
jgi:FkbM family methyltransferase